MSNRIMYDASYGWDTIPADALMVAHYPYAFPADLSRFKWAVDHKQVVTIDNRGDHPDCHVLDIESGAATIADAPGWLDAHQREKNFAGTLYCSIGNIQDVADAVGSRPHHWWIPQPAVPFGGEFNPHGYPGAVACQFYWGKGTFDASLVTDDTWMPLFEPVKPKPWYGLMTSRRAGYAAKHEMVSYDRGKTWVPFDPKA
jgi:hypothetical protein